MHKILGWWDKFIIWVFVKKIKFYIRTLMGRVQGTSVTHLSKTTIVLFSL